MSEIKHCEACDAPIGEAAKFCPDCGANQSKFQVAGHPAEIASPDPTKPITRKGWLQGRAAVLLLAGAVIAAVLFLPFVLAKPQLYPFCEAQNACGYLDSKGEAVISARFDEAGGVADNGLARVKLDGKYGFINKAGEMVIPARFEDVQLFADNGLAGVNVDDKWGFLDKTGDMVIPARFDEAWGFTDNGLAPVKLDGKWGFIDKALIKPARW